MVGIIDSEIDRDIVDIFGNIPVIAVGFRVRQTVVEGAVGRICDASSPKKEAEQLHIVTLGNQIGIGDILALKAAFRDQCPCHACGEAVAAAGPFFAVQ